MCFKLKKNSDKTINNSLETIHSEENINLNYKKFQNSFLIINDSILISINTKIKKTNNSVFKYISFLNNSEILNLFSLNRENKKLCNRLITNKVKINFYRILI